MMRAPLRALPLSSGDICSLRCKRTPIVTVVTVQRVVCQSFSPRLIPPFLISEKHLNRYCVARLHKMCLQPAWKTKSNQWSYNFFHHFEKSPKCSTSLSLDIHLIFIWSILCHPKNRIRSLRRRHVRSSVHVTALADGIRLVVLQGTGTNIWMRKMKIAEHLQKLFHLKNKRYYKIRKDTWTS